MGSAKDKREIPEPVGTLHPRGVVESNKLQQGARADGGRVLAGPGSCPSRKGAAVTTLGRAGPGPG